MPSVAQNGIAHEASTALATGDMKPQESGSRQVHLPLSDDRAADPSVSAPSAACCEASRAGGCPAGCSVARNATKAVVSAGLKFFPYAGIFPPPWITWR